MQEFDTGTGSIMGYSTKVEIKYCVPQIIVQKVPVTFCREKVPVTFFIRLLWRAGQRGTAGLWLKVNWLYGRDKPQCEQLKQ
jgi:hypothetical protein